MPLLSFATLITVAVVPLAAALYVVTSTTWSAVERAFLFRDQPDQPEQSDQPKRPEKPRDESREKRPGKPQGKPRRKSSRAVATRA